MNVLDRTPGIIQPTGCGWSLYTMETGWISGEILSVIALRQMKTSLWDLTASSTIPHHFKVWRGRMLPDEVLAEK